jgi:hypothetical protein
MDSEETHQIVYWPHWYSFGADGVLFMKVSLWTDDPHISAEMRLDPTHPDYPFWVWLVKEKKYKKILSERDLPSFKQEFADWL